MGPAKAAKDGLSTWDPSTHKGDQYVISTPDHTGIWDVK